MRRSDPRHRPEFQKFFYPSTKSAGLSEWAEKMVVEQPVLPEIIDAPVVHQRAVGARQSGEVAGSLCRMD
jgi:hypothetical protein